MAGAQTEEVDGHILVNLHLCPLLFSFPMMNSTVLSEALGSM